MPRPKAARQRSNCGHWNRSEHHWTNSSCRAWTIPKLMTVAHELGHCFGLDHNEDTDDINFDLMHSTVSAYFDWLKDKNREIIQHHFRDDPPPVSLGVRPMVELHY